MSKGDWALLGFEFGVLVVMGLLVWVARERGNRKMASFVSWASFFFGACFLAGGIMEARAGILPYLGLRFLAQTILSICLAFLGKICQLLGLGGDEDCEEGDDEGEDNEEGCQ